MFHDGDRTCPRCQETKAEGLFGYDRARKDGRKVYCFACHARVNREARAARTLAKRTQDAHAMAARYRTHPAAFACHVYVGRAVAQGRLTKGTTCESCGRGDRPVEGHHYRSYRRTEWYTVQWVCRSCHRLAHTRMAQGFGNSR